MVRVFVAVLEQIAVQLLDMIFVERDMLPGREEQFHHFCIARDFLFVAGGEFFDLDVREQGIHLGIAQLAPLDACR